MRRHNDRYEELATMAEALAEEDDPKDLAVVPLSQKHFI